MLSDLFYKLWNAGVIGTGVWETVYMTGLSTLAAYGIGLPLGIVLSVTDGGGLHPIGWLNRALGFVVNVFRSIPFIILMVAGALNVDPAKFQSKSAKSVRSRIGNIRAFLPRDLTLREFWDRLLGELSKDGLSRCGLSPEELAEVSALAEEKYRSWDWTYGRSPDANYVNKLRFPGGTLEVRMQVGEGVIRDIRFIGDYLAVTPNTPAADALRGVKYRRGDVEAALSGLRLEPMFGGITAEEILETLFGGMQDGT